MWITRRGFAMVNGTNFSLWGIGNYEDNRGKIDWVEVRMLFMNERKIEKIFQVRLVKGGLR
jgi:hypothetical protein